jgi:hypothetical protein
VFLYGVGCSEGYSGVGVFECFGNLLCSMFKVCQCDLFVLFAGISFVVIMVRYGVVSFSVCFMDSFIWYWFCCSFYFVFFSVFLWVFFMFVQRIVKTVAIIMHCLLHNMTLKYNISNISRCHMFSQNFVSIYLITPSSIQCRARFFEFHCSYAEC